LGPGAGGDVTWDCGPASTATRGGVAAAARGIEIPSASQADKAGPRGAVDSVGGLAGVAKLVNSRSIEGAAGFFLGTGAAVAFSRETAGSATGGRSGPCAGVRREYARMKAWSRALMDGPDREEWE
jgi:hypothetical protein